MQIIETNKWTLARLQIINLNDFTDSLINFVSLLRLYAKSCVFLVQFSSAQLCLTLCDPVDCSMPGFPVHHQLLELTQTHVHWVSDAIQPVHPKRNQSCMFIGNTDAEAETPILWPPDAKNWLIWKNPDVGKGWRREETGTTEDEMVGCHHRLNGHEFE